MDMSSWFAVQVSDRGGEAGFIVEKQGQRNRISDTNHPKQFMTEKRL
jgi:hypothetical protein